MRYMYDDDTIESAADDVRELLSDGKRLSWSGLADRFPADDEDLLEAALTELQAARVIRHDPHDGTYALADEGESN